MMPYPFIGPNMCDSYSNQVFMNDLTGLNFFTPPFNTTGFCPSFTGMNTMPFMGMNDSIFNACPWDMPFTGSAMPYPSFYPGMDANYYKKMLENQVEYQKQMRAADIELNSAQRTMQQKGRVLNEKIMQNEQEQIMPAFREYIESARDFYGDKGSEEALKTEALDAFERQFQKSVQSAIREHGNNSIWHGFKEVASLGLLDTVSAEQNISEITGQPVGNKEKIKEVVGNGLGGATWGVASWGLLKNKSLASKIPFMKKSPKLWIPLAIGTVVGTLFGKIFTK